MSPRTLSAELAVRHPGRRGTSYGGIRSYVEGRVHHPRIDLLRVIADVLGVRFEWLAYGVGAQTEQAEQVLHAADKVAAKAVEPEPQERALAAMIEEWPALARARRREQAALLQAWAVYLAFDPGPAYRSQETDALELARMIARAARAPLEDLGMDRGDLLPQEEITYLMGISGVLMTLRAAEARTRAGIKPRRKGVR